MRSKILCALLVSLLVMPVLAYGAATITVESVTAPVKGLATIDITVSGVPSPGVATIQGEITFDPTVVSIDTAKGENGLEALQGFDFYYLPQVDNTNGSILFIAGITGTTGPTTGVILRLNVEAVGADGESSPVMLEMSVFRDTNDQDIDKQVYNGLFTISSTELPTANFSYTPLHPVTKEEVHFYPDDTKGSWEWRFGDGSQESALQNPTHTYDKPGTYWVTLKVTRSGSELSATHSEEIRVGNAPPTASFTFSPSSPNPGSSVKFDASKSSDIDGSIVQYQWSFSDGSPVLYTTAKIVYHSFPAAGSYSVKLTAVDDQGGTGDLTKAVPVQAGGAGGENTPPEAVINVEPEADEVKINQIVHFDAADSKDENGTIEAYEWDFETDGTYDATGKTAQHIYSAVGVYTVTLRVTDNEGAFGFDTSVISIQFVSPIADFTFDPSNPSIQDVVSFDGGASSDEDGWVQFYAWDFDDDGVIDATGKFVNHKFATPGAKWVSLMVTDNDGATGTTTKPVFVQVNTPPLPDFTYSPETPTTTDTIAFTSTSSDFDGTIIAWLWEFGDGETSDVQSPSHKYATAKTYIAKLTVTDNDGATSSATENITVGEPTNVPPVAKFSFTPAGPQISQTVQFTDLSTDADGTVVGWAWDFGDGGTSTNHNPTHKYTTVGIYTVALTVTDNEGAVSTKLEKQVTIGQAGAEIVTYSYPNPSSTQAHIVYSYPAGATDITLSIFSVTGARVFLEELPTTGTEYLWDLRSNSSDSLPNGLYFCVITAKDASGKTIKSAIFKLLIAR